MEKHEGPVDARSDAFDYARRSADYAPKDGENCLKALMQKVVMAGATCVGGPRLGGGSAHGGFFRGVVDDADDSGAGETVKADPNNPDHIASPLPGNVDSVDVGAGDRVAKGDVLVIVSAMKMEVKVTAQFDLLVKEIVCGVAGAKVEEGSLLMIVEKTE